MKQLKSPDVWIGIFSILAIAGIGCIIAGSVGHNPRVRSLGLWLGAPLLVGGCLLGIVVIPVLLLANRRVRLQAAAHGQPTGRTASARVVREQLQSLDQAADLVGPLYKLTDAWTAASVGIEAVEPILRFMEDHPSADFGMPGPLVHFVERFHGAGYDELLLESVRRRPTTHTVCMLNRVITGAKSPTERGRLISAMEQARRHPLAEQPLVQLINGFVD